MSVQDRFDRFMAKVDMTPDCWVWTGAVATNGYGRFMWAPGEVRQAHRAAYELAIGPIPSGHVVRHRCDNRICVRPSHLETGTQADNINDAIQRDRAAVGERHPMARLTLAAVVDMRHDHAYRLTPLSVLARRYGITVAQASQIVRGSRWKRAGGPKVGKRWGDTARGWFRELDALRAARTDREPVLVVAEAPGPGRRARRLYVVDETTWLALHGPTREAA